MDWILLLLVLLFAFWAFQMIIVFRRQLARYDEQVASLNESTADVRSEADRYSSDNEEKQKMLDSARDAVKAAEDRESSLKGRVEGLQKDDTRGSTRHRVDLPPAE